MNRARHLVPAVVLVMLTAAFVVAQSTGGKIEGRGDRVTDTVSLDAGLLMVGAAHKGQRNFVVELLSSDGSMTDLLVNTIGDYQGVRLVQVTAAGRYRFQVRADQSWVLMHEQPDPNAAGTALPITHRHNGDAPLGPFALKRGLLRVALTHEGTRNFAATLYRAKGEVAGLLVNTIGRYDGSVTETIRDAGPYWLGVRADGAWSIDLQMDE